MDNQNPRKKFSDSIFTVYALVKLKEYPDNIQENFKNSLANIGIKSGITDNGYTFILQKTSKTSFVRLKSFKKKLEEVLLRESKNIEYFIYKCYISSTGETLPIGTKLSISQEMLDETKLFVDGYPGADFTRNVSGDSMVVTYFNIK